MNIDIVQGVMLATAYRMLGDPVGDRETIEAAVNEVERLRRVENENKEKFDALVNGAEQKFRDRIQKVEEEWNEKIEGFEIKVALAAPREYWSDRASKHEAQAERARRRWNGWFVTILSLSMIAPVVIFTGIGEKINQILDAWLAINSVSGSGPTNLVAGLVKRGLVFGSLLAIAVWWLRQLLRELRSHEHLVEDAAERVTMIETYAALRGAGLDTGDLTPILAALYRTATTGLVDDDSGGPVLPLEIFLKGAADALKK